MSNAARPHRINIDLGMYKQPWLAYCAAHHISPSEAFRQVVAKLMAVSPAARQEGEASTALKRMVRKEIALTEGEALFISACAQAEGYTPTRWIVALIQSRMGAGIQFGQYELEAIGRSNLALLAIGRNLNQIARVLNTQPGFLPDRLTPVILEIRSRVSVHVEEVAAVIGRNVARWRTK